MGYTCGIAAALYVSVLVITGIIVLFGAEIADAGRLPFATHRFRMAFMALAVVAGTVGGIYLLVVAPC